MTAFRYRAARPDGDVLSGTIEAGTMAAALRLVESRGLLPVEVRAAESVRRGRVGGHDLATTLAGLAALLEAGLPVDRALAAAAETASTPIRTVLQAARDQVREGASLSAALAHHDAMPPVVMGYLRAGEKTGHLGAALERAAAELERQAETAARIRAALTYPAFLLVAGVASVAAIVLFVVPRFAQLLGTEGRTLPASTRLLVTLSDVAARFGPAAAAVTVVGLVVLSRALASPTGRLAWHRWLLSLPGLGSLRLRLASARACGALAGLTEASVPLLAALDLVRETAGDRAIGQRLAAAREEVDRGERLAAALKHQEALSPLALRLVAFGEGSGRLAVFLNHAARLESAATQRAIQRLVTLMEPVLILGFGGAVAFVAAALLQAVYSVRPGGL